MSIPKLLFQTSSDAPHEDFMRVRSELIAQNPEWKYRLFLENERREFILHHYGSQITKVYDSINPSYGPARADYFRYLLIYKVGGVYLDLKSYCTFGLDWVLREEDQFILSQWDNLETDAHDGWGLWPELNKIKGGEYCDWFLIAEPDHAFLKAVIDVVTERIKRYVAATDGVGKIGVLRTTGPIPFTLAIQPLLDRNPHRRVCYRDIGLIYSIFEETEGNFGHVRRYSSHYSTLFEPVVGYTREGNSAFLYDYVRRNDRCPCMSGLAFKKCHGRIKY